MASPPSLSPERPLAITTGGAGFLGAHLLRRLAASGTWRLAVVDLRAPPPAPAPAPAAPAGGDGDGGSGDGNGSSGGGGKGVAGAAASPLPPGVEVIVADLRDAAAVVAALAGAARTGVVFHAATAAPTGANAGNEVCWGGGGVGWRIRGGGGAGVGGCWRGRRMGAARGIGGAGAVPGGGDAGTLLGGGRGWGGPELTAPVALSVCARAPRCGVPPHGVCPLLPPHAPPPPFPPPRSRSSCTTST